MKAISIRRRRILKAAGAFVAIPAVGSLLSACGGNDSNNNDNQAALGTEQQLALTASEAVTAMASGSLTATAYITTLLDRAEKLSGLRTIITLDRQGALAAAQRVDSARSAGNALGALAGLPILVKDNINTKDLPTTGGTPALKDFHPGSNAVVLQKLLDAGAIILGKANMHELAFGVTNTNFSPFAGFAKNPYDTTRVPGGSSGGTGAAIAARIVPAGLGSDTGGSVRIPASYNGIAGLRPSTGNGGTQRRYSGTGVLPLSHTLDTVGPLGRSVADVALLDAAITGTAMPSLVPLTGLRIGVPAVLWSVLDNQVAAVMQDAKRRLSAAGAILVDVDMPDILTLADKVVFPLALHEPIADIPAYLSQSGASGITIASIAAQIASPDVKGGFNSVINDSFGSTYPDAINVYRPQLQNVFATYFANNNIDVIVFPTVPILPPPIDAANGSGTVSVNGGAPVDTFTTTIRNMGPGACVGLPSLSIPAGMTPGGLPVGLDIEGPIGSDKKVLGIGMAMEAVFGRMPAPTLSSI